MSKQERGLKLLDKIAEKDYDAIDELLRQDVDLNIDKKGDMAIHLVARLGMMEVLKKLLRRGDSVNKPNKAFDNTPAYYAAREGNVDMVRYMKNKGAHLNKQNTNGDSPLHTAVIMQSMDVIEQLVALGMDVNLQNENGETALHVAVAHSRLEAMEALILCGADPTILTKKKQKAEHLAKSESAKKQLRTYSEMGHALDSGFIVARGLTITPNMVKEPCKIDRIDVVIRKIVLPENQTVGFYCRREKRENSSVKLPMAAQEEVISDVFHIRITDSMGDVDTTLSLPLYAAPTAKEQLVVKYEDREPDFVENYCQTKDETWYCDIDLTLIPNTLVTCGLITRQKLEANEVGEDGKTIQSEMEKTFKLDVPAGAFKGLTKISLQVFDTKDIYSEYPGKETSDPFFHTPIYQINLDGDQPQKKIKMHILQQGSVPAGEELCIVRGDEKTLKDPNASLEVLPVVPERQKQVLMFDVQHFCVHVATARKNIDTEKEKILQRMNSILDKEKPAVFFVMTRKISGREEENLAVVECNVSRDVGRRITKRKKEGFVSQEPDKSGSLMFPPNQEFEIELAGNVALVDETTERRLAFDPRRYSHQQYRVKLRKYDRKPEGVVRINRIISEEGTEKKTETVTVLPLIADIPIIENQNTSGRKMPKLVYCKKCNLYHTSRSCYRAGTNETIQKGDATAQSIKGTEINVKKKDLVKGTKK